MKKLILITFLIVGWVSSNAQSSAIKTKTYYWGDMGDKFYQEFTESGKKILDSLFKSMLIDTSNCIKITSDQELDYLSRNYLSNHNYEYMTIYRSGDVVLTRKYSNKIYDQKDDKKKILLRYSKDFNNEIDKVSIHIMD